MNYRTIRDALPHFDYARYSHTEIVPYGDAENLVDDVDVSLLGGADLPKPKFIEFANRIFMEGSRWQVLMGSAYVKTHPDEHYQLLHFSDEEEALEKFKAVMGYEPQDYELQPDENFDAPANEDCLMSRIYDPLNEEASAAMKFVKGYLRTYSKKTNLAPLLAGHTGISKSSIVKQAIKELNAEAQGYGYRMVEIRAGFLDKMDLMGFVNVKDKKDVPLDKLNDPNWQTYTDSPSKAFLSATTPFVKGCRAWLEDPKNANADSHLLEKIKYYAKTPVIFFDEVNRAPDYILNQVMKIINSSTLQSYDVSIAPKIAAANMPIDENVLPEQAESLIKYLVDDLKEDTAVAGRFWKISVSHTDSSVLDATYDYLSEVVFKDDPAALFALKWAHSNNALYNPAMLDDMGKFPTFRGWEDTCRYLVSASKGDKKVLRSVVQGLLGRKIDPNQFLVKELTLDDSEDNPDDFVTHNIKANVPCLLLGKAGVAKTAKLLQISREMDCEILSVDLSAEDRTTVMGMPTVADFISTIMSDPIPKEYRSDQYDAAKDAGLTDSAHFRSFAHDMVTGAIKDEDGNPLIVPKQTTKMTLNQEVKDAVDRAKARGKKLILVFDEFNRCSPIVQSAIFEAISERRFRGVDLSGADYSVVATGNWLNPMTSEGSGAKYNVKDVDTAALHRFSTMFIEQVNDTMLDSFLSHLQTQFPRAAKLWSSIPKEDLLAMLNDDTRLPNSDKPSMFLFEKNFSMREISGIETFLEASGDFDVLEAIDPNDPDQFEAVVTSKDFVFNGWAADKRFRFESDPELRILFSADKNARVPAQDLLSKSVEIMRDPNVSKDLKNRLASYIQMESENSLQQIFDVGIKNQYPAEYIPVLQRLISAYRINKTKASLSTKVAQANPVGTPKEQAAWLYALKQIITPDQKNVGKIVADSISKSIKEASSPVESSVIKRAISIWNSSDLGALAPTNMADICRSLVGYEDKFKVDPSDNSFQIKVVLPTSTNRYEEDIVNKALKNIDPEDFLTISALEKISEKEYRGVSRYPAESYNPKFTPGLFFRDYAVLPVFVFGMMSAESASSSESALIELCRKALPAALGMVDGAFSYKKQTNTAGRSAYSKLETIASPSTFIEVKTGDGDSVLDFYQVEIPDHYSTKLIDLSDLELKSLKRLVLEDINFSSGMAQERYFAKWVGVYGIYSIEIYGWVLGKRVQTPPSTLGTLISSTLADGSRIRAQLEDLECSKIPKDSSTLTAVQKAYEVFGDGQGSLPISDDPVLRDFLAVHKSKVTHGPYASGGVTGRYLDQPDVPGNEYTTAVTPAATLYKHLFKSSWKKIGSKFTTV